MRSSIRWAGLAISLAALAVFLVADLELQRSLDRGFSEPAERNLSMQADLTILRDSLGQARVALELSVLAQDNDGSLNLDANRDALLRDLTDITSVALASANAQELAAVQFDAQTNTLHRLFGLEQRSDLAADATGFTDAVRSVVINAEGLATDLATLTTTDISQLQTQLTALDATGAALLEQTADAATALDDRRRRLRWTVHVAMLAGAVVAAGFGARSWRSISGPRQQVRETS